MYDSKKSGAITISHLRFGPGPIRSSYLIGKASFVACHQFEFVNRYDVLEHAGDGRGLPAQRPVRARGGLGPAAARDAGADPREEDSAPRHRRLQARPRDRPEGQDQHDHADLLLHDLRRPALRGRRSRRSRRRSRTPTARRAATSSSATSRPWTAPSRALSTVPPPAAVTTDRRRPAASRRRRPTSSRASPRSWSRTRETSCRSAPSRWTGRGRSAPSQWEKRNIAAEIPVWDPALCIQCNKCALVCPHAAIRVKVYEPAHLASAPATFKSCDFRAADYAGPQVHDPGRAGGLHRLHALRRCSARPRTSPTRSTRRSTCIPSRQLREPEAENYEFFLDLPEPDRTRPRVLDVKTTQFFQPLFEYSGACAGCGETPYIKLLTQLFGDRILIANATGCSSIYGGNLPTTPYRSNREGRGPAWSNSLFEDNAEFGLGMRLALDSHRDTARELVARKASTAPGAPRRGDPLGRADRRGRDRGAAGPRRGAEGPAEGEDRRRFGPAGAPRRLPRPQERLDRRGRRLGLRHRIRRARPRARVRAATSTSWSSTPRSTPTPAASSPRRLPSAPPPSSPRPGRRRPRRTSA